MGYAYLSDKYYQNFYIMLGMIIMKWKCKIINFDDDIFDVVGQNKEMCQQEISEFYYKNFLISEYY